MDRAVERAALCAEKSAGFAKLPKSRRFFLSLVRPRELREPERLAGACEGMQKVSKLTRLSGRWPWVSRRDDSRLEPDVP